MRKKILERERDRESVSVRTQKRERGKVSDNNDDCGIKKRVQKQWKSSGATGSEKVILFYLM